jgi:hypothetical protein
VGFSLQLLFFAIFILIKSFVYWFISPAAKLGNMQLFLTTIKKICPRILSSSAVAHLVGIATSIATTPVDHEISSMFMEAIVQTHWIQTTYCYFIWNKYCWSHSLVYDSKIQTKIWTHKHVHAILFVLISYFEWLLIVTMGLLHKTSLYDHTQCGMFLNVLFNVPSTRVPGR